MSQLSGPSAADSFFRVLLESASDLVAVLDGDGRVRYASPSHQAVLGYAPGDLIGRDAFELVHPEDLSILHETFLTGIARGAQIDTGEFRYRCADGGWRLLDGVGHNMLSDPLIAGVVVTSRDVTERRQAAQELAQNRRALAAQLAELELLYRTAPVGLALVDRELRFVRINERLASINGRAAAAHIGATLQDVIPALAPQILPLYRRVFETGEPVLDFEVHGTTPAAPDEPRDWLVSYYPVRDRDGNVLGVNAVVQDITERRRAHQLLEDARNTLEQRVRERTAALEAALRRLQAEEREQRLIHAALQASEERYRELVESLHDIVFTLDSEGVITYISAAVTPASDYAPSDVIGRRFAEFIHPDDVSTAAASFQQALDGQPEPLEFRVFNKGGEPRWIRTLSRAARRPDGSIELRGVATDVTARRTAEDLARRLQAELSHVQRVATIGEMTAQVAHEINQPLAAIVNFADGLLLRLRDGVADPDTVAYAARQIAGEGRRAAEVIRRLREFIRKGELQCEPSDVNQLIRDVVSLLAGDARRQGIALSLELDERLGVVSVDRIQIQQVVVNLVRNALEAVAAGMQDARQVTIETRHAGGGDVVIEVRDTGVGLPEGSDRQIFEAFFSTKPDGLGIGLAISRSIVEAHGGQLRASRNADRGATFSVQLPIGGIGVTVGRKPRPQL